MAARPNSPAALRRRHFLTGLGVAAVASGCTPSPTVRSARPRTSATPLVPGADLATARSHEAAVVSLLDAALASPKGRTPAQTRLLTQLRTAHGAHHEVLMRRDPLVAGSAPMSSASPTPRQAPKDWAALVAQIGSLEKQAAAHHQRVALGVDEPSAVLLFTSLACFATVNQKPEAPIAAPASTPALVEVGDRATALTVLLTHLRALVEGLEIGSGQLKSTDARAKDGRARLERAWALRDQVMGWMRAEKVSVPPAQLGYDMPGGFGTPAEAAATWALLEGDVLAGYARLTAASPKPQRAETLALAHGQLARVRSLGGTLPCWPGWL